MLKDDFQSIPIALITGYLGAGKTTLLNHILKDPKGHKVAVIVNDIGEINIDADLISKTGAVKEVDNSLVPLQNGCICCTLKNDLMEQIGELVQAGTFDYIIIEASGVCEPIPIAQTIAQMSDMTASRGLPEICHLDNIISVVDANRLAFEFNCGSDFVEKKEQYAEEEDIQSLLIQQMEFANVIVLNKAELVNEEQKKEIKAVIHALCPEAKIIEASYGEVDLDELIDTDNFDFEKAYFNEGWVKALNEEEEHDEGEAYEYGIDTFVYYSRKPFVMDKLEELANRWPDSVIRTKGFLWFENDPKYLYVFEQAGRQITTGRDSIWICECEPEIQAREIAADPSLKEIWDDKYGDRENKIVFIGQNMDRQGIIDAMDACTTDDFVQD
ncbi:CobW family GTP-binding protein [Catenisphaera adipataccumulans]|jgi:G3E family GTPase|uniref:G3E family GTPase n=1 Tax=Catenisphaera adipataccumulans TaxID=700500 RepID=A0A7W8FWM3_9FIRM|nr:GTP-binding protein [Catenisphaera adipataccumulans]MBB5182830.1 G3E family GTPase [Catenisphaera adipataccumulans]